MAHICLNCGHKYAGNFCNECGQKSTAKRLDWHYLFHEIPHSILHVDKGLFFTIKEMLKHPGFVIREYLDGKRAKYFPPLTYLFIIGTLAGLIYLNIPFAEVANKDNPSAALVGKFTVLFGKNYNFVVLGSIPIFAFITWLFYKKERNFVEITTAHFFIFGTINLAIIFSGVAILRPPEWIQTAFTVVSTLLMLGYQSWSYATMFTSRSKTTRIWYGILITFICTVITMIITVGLVLLFLARMFNENPDLLKTIK